MQSDLEKQVIEKMGQLKVVELKKHEDVYQKLNSALADLVRAKPNDKSGVDRRFAIAVTELEKVVAYFKVYVVDGE